MSEDSRIKTLVDHLESYPDKILQIKMLEQKLKRSDEKIATLKTQISILLKLNMDLKEKVKSSSCPDSKLEFTPFEPNEQFEGNESVSVEKDKQFDWSKIIKERFNQMVSTRPKLKTKEYCYGGPKLKAKVLGKSRAPSLESNTQSKTSKWAYIVKESNLKSKKTQKTGLKLRPMKELLKLKEPSPESSRVQAVMKDLFLSSQPDDLLTPAGPAGNRLMKLVKTDHVSRHDDPLEKGLHAKIRSGNSTTPKKRSQCLKLKQKTNMKRKIEPSSLPPLETILENNIATRCYCKDPVFHCKLHETECRSDFGERHVPWRFEPVEPVLFNPIVQCQVKRKYVPILPKLDPKSSRSSVIQTILS